MIKTKESWIFLIILCQILTDKVQQSVIGRLSKYNYYRSHSNAHIN